MELRDCPPSKEAWRLTKSEFTARSLATDQSYRDALNNTPHNALIARGLAVMRAGNAHAKAVMGALKDGEDVPDEVLADYGEWYKLKEHLRRQTTFDTVGGQMTFLME
jgi:hypothetical protein